MVAQRSGNGNAGDRRLEDKVVLVTGASSGIGRAIAVACARAGADLAITYRRNAEGTAETARQIRAYGRKVEVRQRRRGGVQEIEEVPGASGGAGGGVDAGCDRAGADI